MSSILPSNGIADLSRRSLRNAPKVVLLVETSRSFGRDFISGIARYCRDFGPWTFHVTPGDIEQVVPMIKQWGGTGIVARIPNERIARAILKANVPTIALGLTDEQMGDGHPLSGLSEVSSDATNVARMAIEHLLQRGLRHFAYVGFENRPWSLRRGDAFAQQLRAIGYAPHFYCPPKSAEKREWEFEIKLMADWLRTLPVPVGLFACNDDRGRQVLEASRLAQLVVPEDIAVLGVDNDTVLCELVDPPLSSIALGAEAAGYRAAELLDGMMRGITTKPQRIIVEPIRVVARRSTHNFAVDDPDVAAALKYIHQTQGRAISVSQVADVTAMSRRNLERKFRETIGRSVLQEMQLVRLEHAKKLLLETTHPISAISQMSGFGSRSYFNQFFRHSVGLTPRQFRMQFKT